MAVGRCLAAALLVALQGCGYSTGSMMPEGVQRLAVDVFANDTFYREIEVTLSREISNELRQRSPVIVARRRHADAVLTGRITSVLLPTLIENDRDLISEQAVIVTAEVTLTDLRDGTVLQRFTAANRAEYVVERGESRETAFAEALRDLAEDIVNTLENDSFLRERGIEPVVPPAREDR